MTQPYTPQHPKVQAYIATLDTTLDKVFQVTAEDRKRIVSSLRREQDKNYWKLTFHDLPLYVAAQLAGVQVVYPDFDRYEVLYRQIIEGKQESQLRRAGDD